MTRPSQTIHIRLIGTREEVTFWLELLGRLFELRRVSDLQQARDGHVRVFAVLKRRQP